MSRVLSLFLPEDAETAAFRSRRGVERLAGFSDAVVAIAITLVMLPLIELASERGASIDELFTAERYRFAAAALSFVVIGSCWREHHEAYERAATDSRRLVSLNLIWLAAVVFLPVPTALLLVPESTTGGEGAAVALYTATAAVAGFTMRAMEREIRHRCSAGAFVPGSRLRAATRWASPVLLAVAAVLALAGLGSGALWVLLLALPLQWITLLAARRHRRGPAGEAEEDGVDPASSAD